MKWLRRLIAFLQVGLTAACAPVIKTPGPQMFQTRLETDAIQTSDGLSLPLRAWLPHDQTDPHRPSAPRAVILALHGMNDYSNAFDEPGKYWSERGVAVFAYDQRGFGHAPDAGYWAGTDAMADDLSTATRLLRQRYPQTPLYLLGESMGGAVSIAAMTRPAAPPVDGIILSAPAVWGRADMNIFQRSALFLASYTMPWMTLTGQGLNIMPSDNLDMLRALSRDPLVLKETRVDAVHGLCDLMDEAAEKAADLHGPVLMLYGKNDQVVPAEPTYRAMHALPDPSAPQVKALYANGYHMLLRDLQARLVWDDVLAWIANPKAPLPSGADRAAAQVLDIHQN